MFDNEPTEKNLDEFNGRGLETILQRYKNAGGKRASFAKIIQNIFQNHDHAGEKRAEFAKIVQDIFQNHKNKGN